MNLYEYIRSHGIRYNHLSEHSIFPHQPNNGNMIEIVTELIVDNPIQLVEKVISQGLYIPCIIWWDRARIDIGSKIGMGGPRDPRDPDTYFFAEIPHLDKYFGELTTKEEYCQYIEGVLSAYPEFELYPGFDVAIKSNVN